VGADLDDPPPVEHDHEVRRLGGGQAVGDAHRGAALGELGERVAERTLGLGVDRGGRLVEDQQAGVRELGAGERDELASQLAGIGVGSGEKDAEIAGLEADLRAEQDISSEAAAQVALLNQEDVTGHYSQRTSDAIKAFQQIAGYPTTGIANQKTQLALEEYAAGYKLRHSSFWVVSEPTAP